MTGSDRQWQAGTGSDRQAEVGKVIGNVLSLYIPFISYQFNVHLVDWFGVHLYTKLVCVHLYSQLDLCSLV